MAGDILQSDFSLGGYPLMAREIVPPQAFEDGLDCLIDRDGLPYRRGGSSVKSNADTDLLFALWDGYLGPGLRRTALAGHLLDFTVLGADDATPVAPHILGAGNTVGDRTGYPAKWAYLAGHLIMPRYTEPYPTVYAGSRKTAQYSAGNVDLTLGSDQVVGHGTAWAANVDPGMLLQIGPSSARVYIVRSVTDDTHLTLTETYRGATAAGVAYGLGGVARNQATFGPAAASTGAAYQPLPVIFTAGNRLMYCAKDRMWESERGDPQTFLAENNWQLPAGVTIVGGEGLRDEALLFTTQGVWVVAGVTLELTDADGNLQQRLEQITPDLILWSWAGVVGYHNSLIVPTLDGVWLVNSVSAPVPIIGGFEKLYKSYVDAGHHAGNAAVYRGHYFLPIRDSAGAFVDLLVCRLDATRRGRGDQRYAWTRFRGAGADLAALAVRAPTDTDRLARLLGANATAKRVYELGYFTGQVTDGDGSTPQMELQTREYPTGGGVANFIKRLRMRHELAGTGATWTADYTEGDGAWTALAGAAPPADLTAKPYSWLVRKSRRGIRFRLRTTGSPTKARIHLLELFRRASGRV